MTLEYQKYGVKFDDGETFEYEKMVEAKGKQIFRTRAKKNGLNEEQVEAALIIAHETIFAIDKKPIQNTRILGQESDTLELRTVQELFDFTPNTNYIIDQLIYPQNIIMLVSPPKNYKSMLALYISMCVSNGKPLFGLNTKQSNVLYLDKENNETIIHQRLHALKRGHEQDFPNTNFPLHFLIRQGDINNILWVQKLQDTVKKHDIKLIIFDTLHRFGDYDENSANDINHLYVTVFQPLIDEHNCSIIFLHHTNRDRNYRGSGDLLGFVDSAYQIMKTSKDGFTLDCIAARGGEIDKIQGTIEIEQDEHKQLYSARFTQKPIEEIEEESKEQWSKKKEACNMIMEYFKSKGLDSYQKKDIENAILIDTKDEISTETIKNAFKFLILKRVLTSNGRGKYTKINDWWS